MLREFSAEYTGELSGNTPVTPGNTPRIFRGMFQKHSVEYSGEYTGECSGQYSGNTPVNASAIFHHISESCIKPESGIPGNTVRTGAGEARERQGWTGQDRMRLEKAAGTGHDRTEEGRAGQDRSGAGQTRAGQATPGQARPGHARRETRFCAPIRAVLRSETGCSAATNS